jgi:hypothetical protein
VKADRESYPVRGQARVTVTVKQPDGRPAANAEVALAAVDQALLELMPNASWNLLDAMLQRRSWGVETSTAQMEIIGRRHYGRKAVPAGGGGGKSPTRELLDTLLLWKPKLVLDANGQAVVTVPLNDALTTFRIVAVADMGAGLFGTGQHQHPRHAGPADHQRPAAAGARGRPVPRADHAAQHHGQGDEGGGDAARHHADAGAADGRHPGRRSARSGLDGDARRRSWRRRAPRRCCGRSRRSDTLGDARDALKARQRIVPAVPLTVQQATLVQLDGPLSLPVELPADALPGRGGLKLALQPKLAEACRACATGSSAIPSSAWSRRPARPSACATASCGRRWPRSCPPTSMATASPTTSRRARAKATRAATR